MYEIMSFEDENNENNVGWWHHNFFTFSLLFHVLLDDHTRVVLHDHEEEHDDYINANYIDVGTLLDHTQANV